MKTHALIHAIALTGLCSVSLAGTLASYDFATSKRIAEPVGSGSDVNIVSAPAVHAYFQPYITASNYDSRSFALAAQSNISSSNPYVFMSGEASQYETAVAEGNEAYQSFSISISGLAAGETVTLESLTFNYGPSVKGVFDGSAFHVAVYSSLTGYSDAAVLGGASLLGADNDIGTLVNIDLGSSNPAAGTAFSNLGNGTSIAFRLYFGDNSASSSRRHIIKNVSLAGTATPVGPWSLFGGTAIEGFAGFYTSPWFGVYYHDPVNLPGFFYSYDLGTWIYSESASSGDILIYAYGEPLDRWLWTSNGNYGWLYDWTLADSAGGWLYAYPSSARGPGGAYLWFDGTARCWAPGIGFWNYAPEANQ